jgi:hypothetical protein
MTKVDLSKVEAEVEDRRHLSDSDILDERTLRKDMHYRFVQVRPTSIARAKLRGYRIVKPSETEEKTLYSQEDATPEDVIQHGDRVLMAVPKRVHADNRRRVKEMAETRLRSHDQRVRQLAAERKVKLHEHDEEDD